jgi:membrane associated rhomboid family serine protease
MLIPYQVDTLFQRTPWANIGIIALNVLCFLMLVLGIIPDAMLSQLVLSKWDLSELISYQFLHAGVLEISGYILILFWFAVDLFHAFGNEGHIAYWAHVGGLVSGFMMGLILLKFGLVDRTEVDHPTVFELFRKA